MEPDNLGGIIPPRKRIHWLPDNCAPYVIIYTGAQLSGPGAQLSGPGAQLSGSGAQLSAILVCIRHICAPVHVREILQQYTYESDQG